MKTYHLHEKNPNAREIKMIADAMRDGAIAVIPTDTTYALACSLLNKKGIDRICRVTGKKEKQAKMSVLCSDLKQVSDYTMPYSNDVFKTMKRYSPGPYVYILRANKFVQKYFKNNKSEIGIRLPNNEVLQEILASLGDPIISTTLSKQDNVGYYTDPEEIETDFKNDVDILVHSGNIVTGESTVLDCSGDEIVVIREGAGHIE